jgi:hypothetical protein
VIFFETVFIFVKILLRDRRNPNVKTDYRVVMRVKGGGGCLSAAGGGEAPWNTKNLLRTLKPFHVPFMSHGLTNTKQDRTIYVGIS